MVNNIDKLDPADDGPDHIGWRLWQASAAWNRRFTAEMRAVGHPAFAEARGILLLHVGPTGIDQTALVACTGLTKQAVQQALERLESEGLVRRAADPRDARRRRVFRTEAGLAAFATAARVKAQIEADLAAVIGAEDVRALRDELSTVAKALAIPPGAGKADRAG